MPERHDGTRHFAVERFYSLHRHCGKWWRGGEPAVNRRAGSRPLPAPMAKACESARGDGPHGV